MYLVGSEKTALKCIKAFYEENGPCCAGCDYWNPLGSTVGECSRTAPVSGEERMSMLGMESCSLPLEAGQILTPRGHVCAEFLETENWGV